MISERPRMVVFLVLCCPEIPYTPSQVTDTIVASVARLRGLVMEVISEIVPIVQSAQRKEGFSRSQKLTKLR